MIRTNYLLYTENSMRRPTDRDSAKKRPRPSVPPRKLQPLRTYLCGRQSLSGQLHASILLRVRVVVLAGENVRLPRRLPEPSRHRQRRRPNQKSLNLFEKPVDMFPLTYVQAQTLVPKLHVPRLLVLPAMSLRELKDPLRPKHRSPLLPGDGCPDLGSNSRARLGHLGKSSLTSHGLLIGVL